MYLDFLNPATDTRFRNSSGLTSSLFDDAPPPRLVKKDAPKKLTPTPALTPKT